jgi:hypothetical protein
MGEVTPCRAARDRPASRVRRILGFVGEPPNGVSYVRFHQPFRHLRDHGYRLTTLGGDLRLVPGPAGPTLADDFLDGVDAVVFPQMVASPSLADGTRLDLVTRTCDLAARGEARIVYSLDDCPWEIDSVNPAYERVCGSIENARTLLERCDALFVTTPELLDLGGG